MRSLLLMTALAALATAAPDDNFDGRPAEPLRSEGVAPPAAGTRPLGRPHKLWVVARASSARQRSQVANAGVSIEEVQPDRVGGIALPEMLLALRAAGIEFTAEPLGLVFRPQDFPKDDDAFHNYRETNAELAELAKSAPDLASLFSIGKSLEGRDILALRLNSSARGTAPSSRPGIVFMATHHAREHLSTEVPLLLAKHLLENRQKPEIASLLQNRDVYIVPMVNPDGVEWDIRSDSYDMHRKNTRKENGVVEGVDLNRNYAFRWGGEGASADPRADTYRGPSAFSEPETRAVRAFFQARPNLKIFVSYHTFSELILYPWGGTDDQIDDKKALAAYKKMAQDLAAMTGYRPMQSSELYVATGDAADWAWAEHKVFSLTFELTPKSMWDGGFYPGAAAIARTFAANLRPALYLIALADDPYRAAEGGATAFAPVNATQGGR